MPETPDTTEKTIRFGCGFAVGALIGFAITFRLARRHLPDQVFLIATLTGVAVGRFFGALATKHGDRFWQSRWWRW